MPERDVSDLLSARMPKASLELLRSIGEIADERNVGAFVVGGVVRDLLLGTGNYDLDVVVEDEAAAFADEAARVLGGSVKAHTRFGTAILTIPGGRKVDLATARREVYVRPGALPEVSAGPILEDLERRDFTINAMAVRLNGHGFGTLIDHYGGEADLEARVLRVLTERSFEDDPTRVLRGVRFAARFGCRFEGRTEELLHESVAAGALSTVSGERIANEIALILSEPDPWPPVERMIAWGILPAIHSAWTAGPGLEASFAAIAGVLAEPALQAEAGDRVDAWRVYATALLAPAAPDARVAILERLNAGRRLRDAARHLERLERESMPVLANPGEVARSAIYRALEGLGDEALLVAAATAPSPKARGRVALFLTELRRATSALTGADVVALGVEEGPRVGEILAALLDARLDGRVGSEPEERALAQSLVSELDVGHKSC